MQFYAECAIMGALCLAHSLYLYSGYNLIIAKGLSASRLLEDPLFSFLSLRVGDGSTFEPIPIAGPVFYLCAVYFASWFMSWRHHQRQQYFSLSGVMCVYNIYTTLLSGFMFALFVSAFVEYTPGLTLLTYRLPKNSSAFWAAAMWINYQSKYIEYVDTLIAVFRGKKEQVSDLQLIHHAEMGPLMWVFCKLCPGGNAALGPCINSLVHFVMYGYYGLTGLKVLPSLTGAVKPYITSFQILQFVVLLVQSCFHLCKSAGMSPARERLYCTPYAFFF